MRERINISRLSTLDETERKMERERDRGERRTDRQRESLYIVCRHL